MVAGLTNKSQSQVQASSISSPVSQNQSMSIFNSVPKISKDGNNTSTNTTFEMIYKKIDLSYRAKEAQLGTAGAPVKENVQKPKVNEEPVKVKHPNMQSRERIQSVPEMSLPQKNSQEKLSKPYLHGITEEPLEQKSPKCTAVVESSGGNNDVNRRVASESNWPKHQYIKNLQNKKGNEPVTLKTEPNKTETLQTEESKGLENKFKEHFKKQMLTQPNSHNKNHTDFMHSISIQSKILHLNDSHITKSPSFSYKKLSITGAKHLENIHTPQQSKNSLSSAKNNSLVNLEISPEVKSPIVASISNSDSKPSHKKNSKSLVVSKPSARPQKKPEDIKAPKFTENKNPISTPVKTECTEPIQKPASPQHQRAVSHIGISHTEPTENDMGREAYVREKLKEMNKHHFKMNNNCPDTVLDYYRLMKMIGKGAFGIVYLGIHLLTGLPVAIKAIDKKYMQDETSKQKVLQEVAILKQANHRNIIQLLEMFENPTHLFIVLEYASQGDLYNFVKNKGKLGEELAKKIFVQIVAGIKYCHQNQILHRDIKLDNILLDHNFVVKICDFGVSRFVEEGQVIKEQCGTPVYVAPEVITGKGYEGYDSDIWSLGVVLFAILTGGVPFKATTIEELQKVLNGAQYTVPEFLTPECKDLIKRMLTPDPHSRISIEQILSHKWLNKTQSSEDDKGKVEKGSSVQIIDTVVRKVEALGYPREYVIQSVRQYNHNHIFTCYLLFYKEYMDSMW